MTSSEPVAIIEYGTLLFYSSLRWFIFQSVHGQSQADSIYVGQVRGVSLSQFVNNRGDTINGFGLKGLARSNNKIEILFYENVFSSGLFVCTVLSFDKGFSISRKIKMSKPYNSKSNEANKIDTLITENPLVIFHKLIAAGVFSLPIKPYDAFDFKIMTSKGLTDADRVGVLDGVSYTLEYKADGIYNRLSFGNSNVYAKSYPDNQVFRRQKEIIDALGSGIN